MLSEGTSYLTEVGGCDGFGYSCFECRDVKVHTDMDGTETGYCKGITKEWGYLSLLCPGAWRGGIPSYHRRAGDCRSGRRWCRDFICCPNALPDCGAV